MATHSGTLAWKILWTEEPGRYSSWGCTESDTTEQLTLMLTLKKLLSLMGGYQKGQDCEVKLQQKLFNWLNTQAENKSVKMFNK